ncbi:MAG: transposase [Tannerellaceae bacterium]|nr:transposase [Tannerellaceae bacterium]
MYTKDLLTSFEELLRVKYTKYYSNKLLREHHPHKYNLFGLPKMLSDYEVGNIGLKINDKEKDIYNIETLFIAYVYLLKTKAKAHQLCTAHLLRELLNFEKSLHDSWSVRMKELLYRAIALKHTVLAEDYQNPSEEVVKLHEELDVLLSVDASGFHRKEQAFIKRLQKHRQRIFTFLLYPNVPPDNNDSERAIRNVKVKTKVSGRFRNAEGRGADRFARIRFVIDATIKNGQDVFSALKCFADIQWMNST